MKRRKFIRSAALGTAAGAVLTGCGSQSGDAPAVQTDTPMLRWRLASSFARSLDTIYGAAEVMSERVSQLTNGRFTIRVYPAGEMVPAFEVLESVQKGTVQMGHSAGYYYIGKNLAFVFETTVPLVSMLDNITAGYMKGVGWLSCGNYLQIMVCSIIPAAILARRWVDGSTGKSTACRICAGFQCAFLD